MSRGKHRPNGAGRVDRGAFARLGRELSTGFSQLGDPNAPKYRPAMHSCGSCGEMTSSERGTCADCSARANS